jgi:hypothetical protein
VDLARNGLTDAAMVWRALSQLPLLERVNLTFNKFLEQAVEVLQEKLSCLARMRPITLRGLYCVVR